MGDGFFPKGGVSHLWVLPSITAVTKAGLVRAFAMAEVKGRVMFWIGMANARPCTFHLLRRT